MNSAPVFYVSVDPEGEYVVAEDIPPMCFCIAGPFYSREEFDEWNELTFRRAIRAMAITDLLILALGLLGAAYLAYIT